MNFDVAIIGGGAAGLFCAAETGRRGHRVVVIEHNVQLGRKIIISGGGRCNFTNIHTRAENFVSRNPHFAKSALARYTPQDFVELVRRHRIDFYEKKLGQLFCRGRSSEIVEMLTRECERAGVTIITGCRVTRFEKTNDFEIETSRGRVNAERLVIATGGLSFPKIGATAFGYEIAKQFGLAIEETRPSLVGLVMAGGGFSKLAGISVDSEVEAGEQTFRENILFTHRGLSGPAVLQASNYWRPGGTLKVDLMPGVSAEELLTENIASRKLLGNFLAEHLPARFAEAFVEMNFENKPLDAMGKAKLSEAGRTLNAWEVRFAETEGWHKAEVTLGGVSTDELSSQTMEAKKVPGLYFIGEVVDVTGWLGGYNFQWAWASAHAAATAD